MGRESEALRVLVIGTERQTKLGRAVEAVVERLPAIVSDLPIIRLGLRPVEKAVIPRPVGTRGALNDPQEALEVHEVAAQLRDKLNPARRPDISNPEHIDVVRVRRARWWDHLGIIAPTHGRKKVLRHGNVTADYLHSLQTAANEHIPSQSYDTDQAIVTQARNLSQELDRHHIPAPEEGVRRLIHNRLKIVEHKIRGNRIERFIWKLPDWVVDHVSGFTSHMIGFDIDKFAEEVALEAQSYGIVSGKKPEVGFGGLMLGVGELALGVRNLIRKNPKNDAIQDFIFSEIYQRAKYPQRRVFNEFVHHKMSDRVLELAGLTPVLPATWALWAIQMIGRAQLRAAGQS